MFYFNTVHSHISRGNVHSLVAMEYPIDLESNEQPRLVTEQMTHPRIRTTLTDQGSQLTELGATLLSQGHQFVM